MEEGFLDAKEEWGPYAQMPVKEGGILPRRCEGGGGIILMPVYNGVGIQIFPTLVEGPCFFGRALLELLGSRPRRRGDVRPP